MEQEPIEFSSSISPNSPRCLTTCKLNGISISDVLVDTGSSVSFINLNSLQEVYPCANLESSDVAAKSVNRSLPHKMGRLTMTIEINNSISSQQFLVVQNISPQVILGTDYFPQTGATLVFKDSIFMFYVVSRSF